MKFVEYREALTKPLRQATLCLLVRDDEVLLAMEKRGSVKEGGMESEVNPNKVKQLKKHF